MPPPPLDALELLRLEITLYSLTGMLRRGNTIAPGGHQAFYAAACHVATMLQTRETTPMLWRIALDMFQIMERIWEDRDVAERDHLRSYIFMAREHLGIVDGDPAAAVAATDAAGSGNPLSADVTDLEIATADRLPASPASAEAMEGLTSTVVIKDGAECAICLENITVECNVLEMPCKHIFHAPCLKPWLDQNRSCPLCRHELVETKAAPSVGASNSDEPAETSTS